MRNYPLDPLVNLPSYGKSPFWRSVKQRTIWSFPRATLNYQKVHEITKKKPSKKGVASEKIYRRSNAKRSYGESLTPMFARWIGGNTHRIYIYCILYIILLYDIYNYNQYIYIYMEPNNYLLCLRLNTKKRLGIWWVFGLLGNSLYSWPRWSVPFDKDEKPIGWRLSQHLHTHVGYILPEIDIN